MDLKLDFKKLVYISGKNGLHELVGNRNNGVIAKSIDDGNAQFYSSRIHQFTPLDSIEMYTNEENVPLRKIMQSAQEKMSTHPPVDANSSNDVLKNYFKIVLPNYDEDRVRISDIKKFVKWFSICKNMDFSEAANEEVVPVAPITTQVESESAVFEEKPVKKAARKKATKVEEDAAAETPVKEKKPRASKKKAE